ncbi:hypothetical protein FHX48_002066 [Microbacterium halimionae]|uniref:Uncharacterized protein n=1 Tax=Microbacterium halimionae TaxID=1526413 RepID=A0A7W3PMH4_9MICO|nr:hypothetical protein [Microbacterium halimionae]MBA8816972.1 hypothetical protein [Microbacterium halimionae]NII94489.1 hypothetical protein [Microbacterium halimionae]
MSLISSVLAGAGTSSDESVDIFFYIILAVILALVVFVMRWIFARRANKNVAGTAGGASDGLAIRIAPAPPFPEDVARLRTLLGATSPAPRITRYSVPVVTTDAYSLTIRDKKIGEIVSIPLKNIASIEAREAAITPKGTFIALKYPSLWITIRRETSELAMALTPIVGTYDKVRQSDVEAMAAELESRLNATHP